MKLVYIKWVDSSETVGWVELGKINNDLDHCDTVGWVLREDKLAITVAASMSETEACAAMTIPKKCIISYKEIKL